jgi:hypothetical protein
MFAAVDGSSMLLISVCDHQTGFHEQSPGDRYALSLSAAERVPFAPRNRSLWG